MPIGPVGIIMPWNAPFMIMLNGDSYVPMLMKMLANPSGPQLTPENIWPDFAKRFFAA